MDTYLYAALVTAFAGGIVVLYSSRIPRAYMDWQIPRQLPIIFQSIDIDKDRMTFCDGINQTELLEMAKRDFGDPKLQEYVHSQYQDEIMDYQLAIGITAPGRQNGSDLSHAILVVRRSPLDSDDRQPRVEVLKPNAEEGKIILEPNDVWMIVHLHRNKLDGAKTMQVGWDHLHSDTECRSLMNLVRLRTTRRLIYVLALKSCPIEYQTASRDCFFFARENIVNLFKYVEELNLLPDSDIKKFKKDLKGRIVACKGMTGVSENESRGSNEDDSDWS